ncbi:MAG: SDR family NAD(P)-dependent oxidoreductase [Bacteriovoracaceae bacterium]|nr:SDR family NAD(P)-dependent oxidoreductase [Bacteriovoracaceae bacterium]
MKILVTGCAGFIASKVSEFLLDEGHKVVGVDNMNDYYDVRLKDHRVDKLKNRENFEFHKVDIENYDELATLFEKHNFDIIHNLAARAGVRYSMENPDVYMTTNAMGTLNILKLMVKHDIKKMVLASTSSLYAGQQMPFLESLAVNTPISPYAASKKSAEMMCHAYHHLYDLDISVVRYFTVYGPCGRPDMCIFRFIRWIYEGTPIELFGDGTQARDFTFVDDIARGTILAGQAKTGFEVINLGGGNNPISLNYVIKYIEDKLGKKAKYIHREFHKADIKETWANIDKAGKLLNWKPQISLEEGLDQCIQDFLDNEIPKIVDLP